MNHREMKEAHRHREKACGCEGGRRGRNVLGDWGSSLGESPGFLGGSDGKESACNAGELGLIPGSGRSPGKGNGNPLQYSCLESSMNRGVW